MPISDKQQATRMIETLRTSFPLDVKSQTGHKITLKKNGNTNTKIKDTVDGKLGPKRAKKNGNAFKDRIKGTFGKTPIESQKVKNLKDFHEKAVQIYKNHRLFLDVAPLKTDKILIKGDWLIELSPHQFKYSLEKENEIYEGSMNISRKMDYEKSSRIIDDIDDLTKKLAKAKKPKT